MFLSGDTRLFYLFVKGFTNAQTYEDQNATGLDPSQISLGKVTNARKPFALFEEIFPWWGLFLGESVEVIQFEYSGARNIL